MHLNGNNDEFGYLDRRKGVIYNVDKQEVVVWEKKIRFL